MMGSGFRARRCCVCVGCWGGRPTHRSIDHPTHPSYPHIHTYINPGVLDCVRSVVGSQGPRALYKGALTNALGQIPNNAIVFGSYGSTLAWLDRTFPLADADGGGGGGGGYWHVFLAGCWAGFLQCLALGPFEHIKLQQQTADWRPGVRHMGLMECARGLVASKGVAGGLYRGFWSLVWRCVCRRRGVTVWSASIQKEARVCIHSFHRPNRSAPHPQSPYRDAPTYGLYFVVYERLKDLLAPPGAGDAVSSLFHPVHTLACKFLPSALLDSLLVTQHTRQPAYAMLVAGGLAGMAGKRVTHTSRWRSPSFHLNTHQLPPPPNSQPNNKQQPAWAAACPMDVIKSVIQGSSIATPAAHNRISAVAARLYKAEVRMRPWFPTGAAAATVG